MNGIDVSISLEKCRLKFTNAAPEGIEFWYHLLRRIPASAGLQRLEPPIIYVFPNDHVPNDQGVSGTMLMVQSHCAFHWWSKTRFCHWTISSCREFEPEAIIVEIGKSIFAEKVEVRGQRW